jgi:hypothetical protein
MASNTVPLSPLADQDPYARTLPTSKTVHAVFDSAIKLKEEIGTTAAKAVSGKAWPQVEPYFTLLDKRLDRAVESEYFGGLADGDWQFLTLGFDVLMGWRREWARFKVLWFGTSAMANFGRDPDAQKLMQSEYGGQLLQYGFKRVLNAYATRYERIGSDWVAANRQAGYVANGMPGPGALFRLPEMAAPDDPSLTAPRSLTGAPQFRQLTNLSVGREMDMYGFADPDYPPNRPSDGVHSGPFPWTGKAGNAYWSVFNTQTRQADYVASLCDRVCDAVEKCRIDCKSYLYSLLNAVVALYKFVLAAYTTSVALVDDSVSTIENIGDAVTSAISGSPLGAIRALLGARQSLIARKLALYELATSYNDFYIATQEWINTRTTVPYAQQTFAIAIRSLLAEASAHGLWPGGGYATAKRARRPGSAPSSNDPVEWTNWAAQEVLADGYRLDKLGHASVRGPVGLGGVRGATPMADNQPAASTAPAHDVMQRALDKELVYRGARLLSEDWRWSRPEQAAEPDEIPDQTTHTP